MSDTAERLAKALELEISMHPISSRPIGAPYSPARMQQENIARTRRESEDLLAAYRAEKQP